MRSVWGAITSLKLAIACMALLMVLVVACTLAQAELGTFGAVNAFMRSPVVWWRLPGAGIRIPALPGGGLVGLVLLVNLAAAQVKRLELSWRKAGLWIVHAGLILLFAGEFVTAFFQVDMRLAIENGQTRDFLESPREMELVVVDRDGAGPGQVHAIAEPELAKGGTLAVPETPFTLVVHGYNRNARLTTRGLGEPASPADRGVGARMSVAPAAPVTSDEETDSRAVFVELIAGGRSLGTWLLSNVLAAPQQLVHDGHRWLLGMRPRREALPYSLTLEKFSHDVYPGTTIPKSFSSLVRLSDPARREERDALISMNQPLRYAGRTFYQASFGKGDTLSVLQVVKNPGWLLPYLSCALVAAGLVLHFALALGRSLRKPRPAEAG